MKGSLKLKTVLATLLAALLLMAAAAAISYQVYSGTIYGQYKTMTMNLAKTEAVTVNAEDVAAVRDEVLRIYRKICKDNGGVPNFADFTEEQWEAYYKNYEDVPQMPEYQRTLQLLHEINDANDINSIYIGYMDVETYYGIYLVDGSVNAEACQVGTCDPFEESNAEQMRKGDYDFPAYITNYEEYGWLCSAGAGIYDDNGEIVGTAMLDISMDEVVRNLHEFLFNLCLVLTIITVVICLVILFAINKTLLIPVKSLSQAAASFVSEKEKDSTEKVQSAISRLEIHTGDEIEELSDAIKTMEKEINDYIDHLTEITAEKERMGAELNIATQIQASMLPCIFPAFPDRKEFDIYATMTPAKEVGGDFYDFFMVDETHLAIVMADVSGKGVPAALFMVIGKTLIKDHTTPGRDLGEVFSTVNNLLCEANSEGLFITAFEGVLDLVTGEFCFVNAGHEMPFICKAGGSFAAYKIRPGFVLAGFEDMNYKAGSMTLDVGDLIFQYTDGVTEATNVENQLYGMERLEQVLNRVKDRTPSEILPEVKKDIDAFVGEAPQFDDITMLCVEYKAKMEKA